jgi:hypothetical protein
VRTIVAILDCIGKVKYTTEFLGISSNFGASSNELAMHLDDAADDTIAVATLAAAALPTCSDSGLDITVNAGTWLVSDVTSVTADASDEKTLKATIAIDDTSGDIEVIVYEKTVGEYGSVPAGKVHCEDLKEYTLAALGSSLTEVNDWIE